MSRRVTAALAIVSYLLAVAVVPELHRLHHAAHGADHEHTAAGTIYTRGADLGSHHAAFDQTLVDLGLADVGTAGTLTVDCSYTDITLATCDVEATSSHARTFGDDLLARTHHSTPPDPHHGDGSLEHLSSLLVANASFHFVPPVQRFVLLVVPARYTAPALVFASTRDARGPPRTT